MVVGGNLSVCEGACLQGALGWGSRSSTAYAEEARVQGVQVGTPPRSTCTQACGGKE